MVCTNGEHCSGLVLAYVLYHYRCMSNLKSRLEEDILLKRQNIRNQRIDEHQIDNEEGFDGTHQTIRVFIPLEKEG